MGAAKNRGSFEERCKSAMVRNEALRAEAVRKAQEKEDNMTKEEKKKRNEARQLLGMFGAMASRGSW